MTLKVSDNSYHFWCDHPGCDQSFGIFAAPGPVEAATEAREAGWRIDGPHTWCPTHEASQAALDLSRKRKNISGPGNANTQMANIAKRCLKP